MIMIESSKEGAMMDEFEDTLTYGNENTLWMENLSLTESEVFDVNRGNLGSFFFLILKREHHIYHGLTNFF